MKKTKRLSMDDEDVINSSLDSNIVVKLSTNALVIPSQAPKNNSKSQSVMVTA